MNPSTDELVKVKYFNLSKPIQIKEFEEFKAPMGWRRLNKKTILDTEGLTRKEYKHLLNWENYYSKEEIAKIKQTIGEEK